MPDFTLNKEQEKNIVELYRNELSMTKIGKKFNVSTSTISRCLKRNNVITKELYVLTQEQQLSIIELYNNKNTLKKLAETFNVSIQAISNVLKRNNIETRDNRKYTLDEHFFDNINTQEKAYILGLLYADGYNTGHEIGLGLIETEKELLINIRKLFKSNRPLRFIDKNSKNKNHNNIYVLEFSSVYLCEQAKKIGLIKSKTLKLTFPNNLNYNFYVDFIRGYFDGDGSISMIGKGKKKTLCWNLISTNNFCLAIKEIIYNYTQINIGIYQDYRVNSLIQTMQIGGNKNVRRLMDWLYKDATIWMKRKRNKYEHLVTLMPNLK